jgi:CRISPR-associated endoribonuclease Cas6
MIIEIKFSLSVKKQILPLNYQYPVSAWIYKILGSADADFSQALHEQGYKTQEGKTFKFFTFSKLRFPNNTWKIISGSDRMEIKAQSAYLKISFLLPKQLENFVIGLFKEQNAFIGDKISGINMNVERIEVVKPKLDTSAGAGDLTTVKLKTITPIVLGLNVDNIKNEEYIEPSHQTYKKLFLTNLVDKYKVFNTLEINYDKLNFTITKFYKNKKGKAKTGLQTIKAFTPAQTKVKGYYYEFELTAPANLIKTGLNAGFGSMNALGFGFCELISETKS